MNQFQDFISGILAPFNKSHKQSDIAAYSYIYMRKIVSHSALKPGKIFQIFLFQQKIGEINSNLQYFSLSG